MNDECIVDIKKNIAAIKTDIRWIKSSVDKLNDDISKLNNEINDLEEFKYKVIGNFCYNNISNYVDKLLILVFIMIDIDWNKELKTLVDEYTYRDSKFTIDTPSQKELMKAVTSYKLILDDAEIDEEYALAFLNSLASYSHEISDQIKLFGAMFELIEKYPGGIIPKSALINISEKWGVLDYVINDIFKILGQKADKSYEKHYLTDEEMWNIIKEKYDITYWNIIKEYEVIEHISEIEQCLDKLDLKSLTSFCLCLKRQSNIDIKWANKLCGEFYMLDSIINIYYDKIQEGSI